ncbi:MAG: 2-dehydro-3-deoxygalactonokinase [Clostridia bacterium]|nr:2-dehydro-3-deoxygalactonokinase [Clostridia bacterium]
MFITVDCGTTNMRCRLFNDSTLMAEAKRTAGCRNTAFSGTSDFLRQSLKECIKELLDSGGLAESDIEAVISSGTLASDVGIYYIPHVIAPVGIAESAAAARLAVLEDITSIPILFIPGVKTLPQKDEHDMLRFFDALESMSGEECETYGIMSRLGIDGDFVITLPGSYNKVFKVDASGRITWLQTGMCGEFIAAMSEHTLLKHSLPHPVIQKIIPESLYCGFDYATTRGVSPSLIKARTTQLFGGWNKDAAANFFVGALLKDDIMSIYNACGEHGKLIVGGGDPLRSIFELLLRHAGAKNLTVIDDETARLAPSIGAMLVYSEWKKNN